MWSPSGQDVDTLAAATCLIVSTRRATAAVLTRDSGVPSGTSATATTCDAGSVCVPPVTATDRTTSSREPSSAQATAAITPAPASAKNAARHLTPRGVIFPRGEVSAGAPCGGATSSLTAPAPRGSAARGG